MSSSDQMVRDMDRRLRELERTSVTLRKGKIQSGELVLGGDCAAAGIPNPSSAGLISEGDTVAALTGGGNVIALGAIGDGSDSGLTGGAGVSVSGRTISLNGCLIPEVATLPESPTNGWTVVFNNWLCRFDTSPPNSGRPWEVIGGAALFSQTSTISAASAASYSAPSGGLSITLPAGVHGEFEFTQSAELRSYLNNGAHEGIFLSHTRGSTAASDDWSLSSRLEGNGGFGSVSGTLVVAGTLTRTSRGIIPSGSGSATIAERVKKTYSGNNSGDVRLRSLRVMPTWIGVS